MDLTKILNSKNPMEGKIAKIAKELKKGFQNFEFKL
jgi:hypothetical protein